MSEQVHELKCEETYFEAVMRGEKTFKARERLEECATCIEKHSYPTPDKEDTPWAVARRARAFLNRENKSDD